MSDPRWFKLLVRAIGVLVIALAVPHLGQTIATGAMLLDLRQSAGGGPFYDQMYVPMLLVQTVSVLFQLGLGVYLLRGAPALTRFCIRQVGRRCPACDYDLQGLAGKCPECGLEVQTAAAQASEPPVSQ